MFFFGDDKIPVTPDALTAKRWLQTELKDSIYHQGEGLMERIIRWVEEFFADLFQVGSGSSPILLAIVVFLVLGIIVGISLWVAGPVRRRKRMATSAQVLAGEDRTATELRAAARALAQAGQWRLAVLDLFRALVRSLADRVIIDDRPGWTADEAAHAAADRLPDLAAELLGAGQMFDAAFYGERDVDEAGFNWMQNLDERVQNTRPTPVAPHPQTATQTTTSGGELQ